LKQLTLTAMFARAFTPSEGHIGETYGRASRSSTEQASYYEGAQDPERHQRGDELQFKKKNLYVS
jgi:hypothetical protein